jgi:outer membrane lipoprotein carrier protein
MFILFNFFCAAALCIFWPSVPIQTEIDQLIAGLQAKYDKLSTLSADFTQIYNAPGSRSRRESGRVTLKKPGKMRWDYSSPESKLFVCDGKSIYEYVPSEKYATRSSVRDSDDLRAPFAFLLGRGKLRRDFKQIEFSAEAPARAGNRVLRLIPKRAVSFRELLLELDPASLQMSRLTMVESDGARSDFLFSNLRENAAAADGLFAFKAPEGVEIRNN